MKAIWWIRRDLRITDNDVFNPVLESLKFDPPETISAGGSRNCERLTQRRSMPPGKMGSESKGIPNSQSSNVIKKGLCRPTGHRKRK
jgi:hypothetical protein